MESKQFLCIKNGNQIKRGHVYTLSPIMETPGNVQTWEVMLGNRIPLFVTGEKLPEYFIPYEPQEVVKWRLSNK